MACETHNIRRIIQQRHIDIDFCVPGIRKGTYQCQKESLIHHARVVRGKTWYTPKYGGSFSKVKKHWRAHTKGPTYVCDLKNETDITADIHHSS